MPTELVYADGVSGRMVEQFVMPSGWQSDYQAYLFSLEYPILATHYGVYFNAR